MRLHIIALLAFGPAALAADGATVNHSDTEYVHCHEYSWGGHVYETCLESEGLFTNVKTGSDRWLYQGRSESVYTLTVDGVVTSTTETATHSFTNYGDGAVAVSFIDYSNSREWWVGDQCLLFEVEITYIAAGGHVAVSDGGSEFGPCPD